MIELRCDKTWEAFSLLCGKCSDTPIILDGKNILYQADT